MFCEHCDSPSVNEEVLDVESIVDDHGNELFIDVFGYTCQNCGYYWEEYSEPHV